MNDTGRQTTGTPRRIATEKLGHGRRWLAGRTGATWRLSITAVAAVLVAVAGIVFAALAARSAQPRAAEPRAAEPRAAQPGGTRPAVKASSVPAPHTSAPWAPVSNGAVPHASALGHRAAPPLVLPAADHRDCPAAATACVDLARHITWLQSGGKTTFGPVAMEPGKPGGAHQTPKGTFRVQWKAGPTLISNTYHVPMPWATFFAPGGIAFHGGSLTQWSHGCIHLTAGNAHYYNAHLPIGAEVVVF